MKKLDEIMELMTEEIADFKQTILSLREITNELNERSIPISTEALEDHLERFLKNQKEKSDYNTALVEGIDRKLKRAALIPKRIIILYCSVIVIHLSLIGYLLYANHKIEKEKQELMIFIETSNNSFIQKAILENPDIKELYCNWLEQTHK